jgi:membrane peptidoglycan carboxypeptidase
MAFDRAIENSPFLPSEIKVADEFRNKYKRNLKRENLSLLNMYEDKVITKAEYTEMKKKLDGQ